MHIRTDDLSGEKIKALLAYHLQSMRENSPPDSVYALDLTGLKQPCVTVFTAWEGDALLGCGALKELGPDWGEIKSMRTAADHLRKGVAAALLEHIMNVARERGYKKLSLETGSNAAFEPALALYRRSGFVNGPRYADYAESGFSQYLHRDI
jgi:putative acetyltransferase